MSTLRALYAQRWVRYLLTLLLLAVVIWRAQPQRLAAAAAGINAFYLLLALLLTVPFLLLKIERWRLMLVAAGVQADFGDAARSLMGGMGLALVTPARLGELVRVAYLSDQRKWKLGGLVMIDKGFDVLVLAGLSVAGAWSLLGVWAGAAMGAVTLAGLAAVYRPRVVAGTLLRSSARLPGRKKLEQVWESLDCLSPASTTAYLVLTLLAFGIVLGQFGILLLSWRSWSPEIVFLTFPLVVLSNVLPVTIGGLGVREGVAALLLAHYGVSPAHAAIAAFLMFFVNTALPGIAGALVLPRAGAAPLPASSLDRP